MPVWIDGVTPRSASGPQPDSVAPGPRRTVRGALALGLALTIAAPAQVALAAPTGGSAGGHGRGMSQLGALEYAKRGWTAAQILAYYYPGTSVAAVNTGMPVTVRLTKRSRVDVVAPSGAIVGNRLLSPGMAVSFDGTTATVRSACGGQVLATVPTSDGTVKLTSENQSMPANQVLRFCGDNAGYRGRLVSRNGQVLNVVGLEDYVRSVVPVENSPGWADQGGNAALQAQAIAARSYALMRGAVRGDQFDDTTASQVYGGVGAEDPRTDAAVASTSGQVMSRNGYVVETEYGASRSDDPNAR